MSEIEQSFALRTIAVSGDNIGVTRNWDPITGDLIKGEQTSQYGSPAKWMKIANQQGTAVLAPSIGSVTISSTTTSTVTFSGAFTTTLTDAPVGMLVRFKDVTGTVNDWQVRKLISVSTNTYTFNRVITATTPAASDPYDLWIPTYRYNFLLLKTEFSASSNTAVIRPVFLSDNHDTTQPAAGTEPGVRRSMEYFDHAYNVLNTGLTDAASGVKTEETSYYHGEILAIPCQGSIGMKIYLTSVSAGNVSIWAAAV